jgi:tetratricopeptide (TPR) repeat protein
MFGFGDSRYKEEARVTVDTCISCARQMDGLFLIDTPELQKIGETVPGFQTEMWVKLLASAQLTHNLMVIMMLVRTGAVKTSLKEFQKTAVYVDQYVNAHPFFGKRLSGLMIELTNQIYSSQNQGIFPRYGWGRWVINVSKQERLGIHHSFMLDALLTFNEAKLADKIDHQITYAMMAGCEPIYSACRKPASLPITDHEQFEDNKTKAEKGDADAQQLLGDCYYNGKGVPQDFKEAVKWYRKAAEQGHADAQHTLGHFYKNGEYVEKDEVEAMKWIRQSADQNYAPAQRSLGSFYKYGECVTKDEVEAIKWFRKAAEQGNARAQSTLGYCYWKGQGVAVDYVEAIKWLRRAANQEGFADDEYFLGCCYEFTKDFVEAYKCYNLALIQGLSHTRSNRDAVAALMTAEQITEAQRLSREFKTHKESASGNSSSP